MRGIYLKIACRVLLVLVGGASMGEVSTAANAPATLPADAGFDGNARAFIEQHCMACHGPKKAKAGFRIDLIGHDFAAPKVAEQWKEVIDRINAGEMPPEGKPRPEVRQSAAFVGWVNGQLHAVELAASHAGGRIPMRRLNRDEYANTVRDLLKLDEKIVRPMVEELPADGKAEGFDRLGTALFFDKTQIERSLSVGEKIATTAIVTTAPKVNHLLSNFAFDRLRPPGPMIEVYPASKHMIPRGAEDHFVRPDYIEYIQGGPQYRKELDGWGGIAHFAVGAVVKQDGYYRIRIKAKVDNRSRTEPNKFVIQYAMKSPIEVQQEVPYDTSGITVTTVFLRGPDASGEVHGPQVFNLLWNHTHDAVINEPKYGAAFSRRTNVAGRRERAVTSRAPQAEIDALTKELNEAIRVLEEWKTPAHIYNPDMDIEKLPRLLISTIEIDGPIQQEWPPASHKELFFAGDDRHDLAYAREIFARFLPRAYRRPVTKQDVDGIVSVVDHAMNDEKLPFLDAMRIGLQRVLVSPGFLFLQEPTGTQQASRPLTDYELASRLSYFLWSTMPDDRLFDLAAAGKLHEPATLGAELHRMLADPKSQEFVNNFAGQWLSVREFSSIQPAAEYTHYDKALEHSAQKEPLAFIAELLSNNLPITYLIDSDFLIINERLAQHYGIDGVKGSEFRRVAIRPENHRGGVLGMAGLMTYLADGTRTLPMHRGSWVLRELFNDPPNNPPPNAGAIQPNTSGKNLTVRQRIEMHRRDDVCASCHAKLDPYGLALENYDAIGEWRERFNGEGFRGRNGPVLDVSGAFPDGRKFTTLEEYKAGLMAQKDKFARAFSTKMLTYALGRPVGYTDHETLDALVGALKKNDYRIQSLIEAIVACEAFRTK